MKLYSPTTLMIVILLGFFLTLSFEAARHFVDDGDDENQTLAEKLLEEDGIVEEAAELIYNSATGQNRDFSPGSPEK